MKEILNVKNISKKYNINNKDFLALNSISFLVNENEFISIMGASGSGKTTLLNCISKIDDITSGEIYLNGKDITHLNDNEICNFRKKELGFIFQDFNLLDTLTIRENIILSLTINKVEYKKINEIIKSISSKLNISDILDKFPYQVSGGQKQKCACARAIVNSPSLILADEPTGSLDSNSSKILLEILQDMNKNMKATILMVTHDVFVASYSNRVLFLKDGKLYFELHKECKDNKTFYNEILDIISKSENRG